MYRRVLVVVVALGAGRPALAQDENASVAPRVVVHGFLSQAFAISDRYQVLGIPSDGTVDYRTAALQLRAAISPKDSFVIQFSQVRLGESPVMRVKNEIDLDWIFYERRFGDRLSARVGKVKLPFGIYNEIRYVGPLLPFFRATEAFYGEGSYTFDSINGAVASGRFLTGHRFTLDADLYGGEWRVLQNDNVTYARGKKALGTQLWLGTPVSGLRFGLGGQRSTWTNVVDAPPGARVGHKKWAASLDGNFARVRLNGEFEEDTFGTGDYEGLYGLVSVQLTDKLRLSALASRAHLKLNRVFEGELSRDYAAGLSYAFRPDVLVKLEKHWIRGRNFDVPPPNLFARPLKSSYVILSVSTIF